MIPLIKKIEDDGMTFPLVMGIFFLILILFLLVAEYMHFMTAFKQSDDAVERSVIAVATQNWDNVYQGVREGYAGGNVKDEITDAWEVVLKKDNIMKEAINIMDLTYKEGNYVREDSNGNILFKFKPQTMEAIITNIGITENGITSVGSGKGLMVEVSYDISVAWITPNAWGKAHPIEVTRTVNVQYKPLY